MAHKKRVGTTIDLFLISNSYNRNLKGHNDEFWKLIFAYKHVLMALFTKKRVIIMYLSIVLDICVGGEFIQNYFKIFSFFINFG